MQYIGTTTDNVWASSYCTCPGADGCFGCPGGHAYFDWLRSSAGRAAASAAGRREQKRDVKDSAAAERAAAKAEAERVAARDAARAASRARAEKAKAEKAAAGKREAPAEDAAAEKPAHDASQEPAHGGPSERRQQKRDVKAHNKERRRKAEEAARLRQQERSRVYTHADYVYEHSDNFDELADAERRDKAAAEAALRNAAAKQKKAAQAYEKMLARPGLSAHRQHHNF